MRAVAFADVLQMLASNQTTCRILLGADGVLGELYLEDGALVHAQHGELEGNEAAFALIAVSGGTPFDVQDDQPAPRHTVEDDIGYLILEAARRRDEGLLPPPDAIVRLPPEAGPEVAAQVQPRRALRAVLAASVLAVLIMGSYLALAPVAAPTPTATAADAAADTAAAAPDPAGSEAAAEEPVLDLDLDRGPVFLDGPPALPPVEAAPLSPTVLCRIRVDETGRVSEAVVYRSRPALAAYENAALAAVRAYRFAPAMRRGKPAAAWLNWPVHVAAQRSEMLAIRGSETIGEALLPALADAYRQRHPEASVALASSGPGGGVDALLAGTVDIAAASRPISADELARAAARELSIEEFVIGYDGVAIIVHPDNPVRALDLSQLRALFSGQVASWSALGGADRAVQLFGRPQGAGTRALFEAMVFQRPDTGAEANDGDGAAASFAPGVREPASNRELIAAVAADPGAVAYLSTSWLRPEVVAVALSEEPGGDAVEPTPESIRTGRYPLHHPLHMYARGPLDNAVARFLLFALSPGGQAIVRAHGFADGALPLNFALEQLAR